MVFSRRLFIRLFAGLSLVAAYAGIGQAWAAEGQKQLLEKLNEQGRILDSIKYGEGANVKECLDAYFGPGQSDDTGVKGQEVVSDQRGQGSLSQSFDLKACIRGCFVQVEQYKKVGLFIQVDDSKTEKNVDVKFYINGEIAANTDLVDMQYFQKNGSSLVKKLKEYRAGITEERKRQLGWNSTWGFMVTLDVAKKKITLLPIKFTNNTEDNTGDTKGSTSAKKNESKTKKKQSSSKPQSTSWDRKRIWNYFGAAFICGAILWSGYQHGTWLHAWQAAKYFGAVAWQEKSIKPLWECLKYYGQWYMHRCLEAQSRC
ncbi:MAG: hypothetical protein H6679_05885 [Epsilonproteobacteria bacterium]|nr:hypothetical protein [Campylobacterota bacterium]